MRVLVVRSGVGAVLVGQGACFAPRVTLMRPTAHAALGRRPRAAARSALIMAAASSSTAADETTPAVSYGPHIKIGKKGNVLNPWGFWVMTYSMVLAITGWLYLKIRQMIGVVTLGLLSPSPEHCCWIMHSWCNLVLKLGFSAPKVSGLENLPPKDETILVCAVSAYSGA